MHEVCSMQTCRRANNWVHTWLHLGHCHHISVAIVGQRSDFIQQRCASLSAHSIIGAGLGLASQLLLLSLLMMVLAREQGE
jgi:hypothetical protein